MSVGNEREKKMSDIVVIRLKKLGCASLSIGNMSDILPTSLTRILRLGRYATSFSMMLMEDFLSFF